MKEEKLKSSSCGRCVCADGWWDTFFQITDSCSSKCFKTQIHLEIMGSAANVAWCLWQLWLKTLVADPMISRFIWILKHCLCRLNIVFVHFDPHVLLYKRSKEFLRWNHRISSSSTGRALLWKRFSGAFIKVKHTGERIHLLGNQRNRRSGIVVQITV